MTLKRFVSFVLAVTISHRRSGAGWLVGCMSLLLLASSIGSRAAQAAGVELRVAIEEDVGEIKIGSSTRAIVHDGNGRQLGEIEAMHAFAAAAAQGNVALDRWQAHQMWIEPTDGGFVYIGNHWYRGRTLVLPSSKGLMAVNYVDLEQYLYSVVGGEAIKTWPIESLKAQAVAARSYVLYHRQRANGSPYDVGDNQGWQVYNGLLDETPGTQAAVNTTAGQVLVNNGRIIEAVFHSSAGGCTENVEDVWIQALPYLRTVQENFDDKSQWKVSISRSDFSSLAPEIGNLSAIEIVETTPICKRAKTLRLVGDAGSRTISGERLRSAFNLRSTYFTEIAPEVTKEKGQNPSVASSFLIKGRGFGHGLGLSQWGAYTLAQQGATYDKILYFYYLNTVLAKVQVK